VRKRLALLALCSLVPSAASAQAPARFSLDSVVSVDAFQGQSTVDDANIVIDVTAVMRLSDGWLMYVRPWFREPRLPRPTRPENWQKEIYQAAVQYERSGRLSTRVDLGYIVSPIGLGMMDTRPGVNPTIATHLSYVQPMPVFDPDVPRVGAIAGSYPLGGQVTVSSARWDARSAIVNSAPTRSYVIGREDNPKATPVFIGGGGVSPTMGLRIGGAYAAGLYAVGEELRVPQESGRAFRMVNLEAEYAFGYTKVSGEVTHTEFDVPGARAIARAWFIQASHTLAPRWFVAGRQEGVSAPPMAAGPRRTFHTTELTLGYRLSRDFTLRGSFMQRKPYTRTTWDQQVGASIVWARRWW
jgi:hypothetical protein